MTRISPPFPDQPLHVLPHRDEAAVASFSGATVPWAYCSAFNSASMYPNSRAMCTRARLVGAGAGKREGRGRR